MEFIMDINKYKITNFDLKSLLLEILIAFLPIISIIGLWGSLYLFNNNLDQVIVCFAIGVPVMFFYLVSEKLSVVYFTITVLIMIARPEYLLSLQ